MKTAEKRWMIQNWPVWYEAKTDVPDPKIPNAETLGITIKIDIHAPVIDSWENLEAVLIQEGYALKWNELKQDIEIYTQGGKKINKPIDRFLPQVQTLMVAYGLCNARGTTPKQNVIYEMLRSIAYSHAYHPVLNWLKTLEPWDGTDYIKQFFEALTLSEKNAKYADFLCNVILKKFLIQSYNLLHNRGDTQTEGVLILAGRQGIGKTSLVPALVPEKYQPDWVLLSKKLDPDDKDSRIEATKYWFCEVGEIGQSIRKNKVDALKNYLTARTDVFRRPYDRIETCLPRKTSFVGTINPELSGNGFLLDEENRRYWPIFIDSVDFSRLPAPEKLWAQVMAETKKNTHYLTSEEKKIAAEIARPARKRTPMECAIIDRYAWVLPADNWRWVTGGDIAEELGLRRDQSRDVGKALSRMIADGFPGIKATEIDTHKARYYLLPPPAVADDIPIEVKAAETKAEAD